MAARTGEKTREREDKGKATSTVVKQGKGICVEYYVTIDRPAHDLYAYWHNFESLPVLMKHLKSVRVMDAGALPLGGRRAGRQGRGMGCGDH